MGFLVTSQQTEKLQKLPSFSPNGVFGNFSTNRKVTSSLSMVFGVTFFVERLPSYLYLGYLI